jgi:hypothetical protein
VNYFSQPSPRDNGGFTVSASARVATRAFCLAAGVLALGGASASASAGRALTLHYAGNRGGAAILRIVAPGDARQVRVSWGDRGTTTVTRVCAIAARAPAALVVPHRFAGSGTYRITARLTRVGCGSAELSTPQSASVFARVAAGTRAHSATVALPPAQRWVSFNESYALGTPSYQMIQGSRTPDGGCSFGTTSMSMAPPASVPAALEEDEVSVDAPDCAAVMEVGSPPASAISATPPAGSSSASAAAQVLPASPSVAHAARTDPVAHAAAVYESAGYWHGWFQDPAGIHVNDVYDHVHWRWNGGCTTETAPGGNDASWSWFPDGWFVNDNAGTGYARYCYNADTSTYMQFENPVFCALTDTYTSYWPNHVDGYYNGSLGGGTAWSDSGLCTGLLGFHGQLVYTEEGVYIHP